MSQNPKPVQLDSPEALAEFAASFASQIRGRTLLLSGDLGAGKTTFAQGLARGLGFTGRVRSPTFMYFLSYDLPGGGQFVHFDLYRLDSLPPELAEQLVEFHANPAVTLAIEWPERLPADFLPGASRLQIRESGAGRELIFD